MLYHPVKLKYAWIDLVDLQKKKSPQFKMFVSRELDTKLGF